MPAGDNSRHDEADRVRSKSEIAERPLDRDRHSVQDATRSFGRLIAVVDELLANGAREAP